MATINTAKCFLMGGVGGVGGHRGPQAAKKHNNGNLHACMFECRLQPSNLQTAHYHNNCRSHGEPNQQAQTKQPGTLERAIRPVSNSLVASSTALFDRGVGWGVEWSGFTVLPLSIDICEI
jgi:hypothetical protein